MIEFFEFLNSCTPLRATSYMGFILIAMFLSYAFIETLVSTIFGKKCDCDETSEEAEDYYDGADSEKEQLND